MNIIEDMGDAYFVVFADKFVIIIVNDLFSVKARLNSIYCHIGDIIVTQCERFVPTVIFRHCAQCETT